METYDDQCQSCNLLIGGEKIPPKQGVQISRRGSVPYFLVESSFLGNMMYCIVFDHICSALTQSVYQLT